MSNCIFLQVGQCGNQLGQEILNVVHSHHMNQFSEQQNTRYNIRAFYYFLYNN